MSSYYTSQEPPSGGQLSENLTFRQDTGAYPKHMYDQYDEDDEETQRWRVPSQARSEYVDDPIYDRRNSRSAAAMGSYGSHQTGQYQDDPFHNERADEEDAEEFDVAADFNNEGPRYSMKYGGGPAIGGVRPHSGRGLAQLTEENRAHSIHDPSYYSDLAPLRPSGSRSNSGGQTPRGGPKSKSMLNADPMAVELITVPALGAEWGADEVHALSKRGKKAVKSEKRSRKWIEFKRDQRGLCGIRWLTARVLVFFIFFLIIAIALTLFFTIPRAPSFSFPSGEVFSVQESTVSFSRAPAANFSFTGSLAMIVDASSSFLPVHFNDLAITVYDTNTNKIIGTGDWKNHVVPKSDYHFVTLPIDFSYTAINASDTTWLDMYNACGHIWPGTIRPDLDFRVVLHMDIKGLVSKPSTSASVTGLTCPFELPGNGV